MSAQSSLLYFEVNQFVMLKELLHSDWSTVAWIFFFFIVVVILLVVCIHFDDDSTIIHRVSHY